MVSSIKDGKKEGGDDTEKRARETEKEEVKDSCLQHDSSVGRRGAAR